MSKPGRIFLFAVFSILVIVNPLVSNRIPGQAIFLVHICSVALILYCLFCILPREDFNLTKTRLDKALFAFFAWSLLSLLLTKYRFLGSRRLVELSFYIVIYFCVVNFFKDSKRIKALVWTICSGLFLVSLYGLAQYFDIAFVGWEIQPWGQALGRRVFSSLGNPNWFSSYLVLCLPLAIAMLICSTTKKEILFSGTITVFSLICLLLTKSLSGWISFSFYILFFIYLLKKAKLFSDYRRKIAILLLILAVLSVAFIIYDKPHFGRDSRPLVERLLRYRASLEMMKDYPIKGLGLGNEPIYADLYVAKFIEEPQYEETWHVEQSHRPLMRDRAENEYLDIGSEVGIPGFIFFIWLIISFFKAHLRRIESVEDKFSKILLIATFTSIGASLVDGFLGFPLHVVPTALLFFIVLGINSSLITPPEGFYVSFTRGLRRHKKILFLISVFLAVFLLLIFSKQFVSQVYLARGLRFKNVEKFKDSIAEYDKAKHWDSSDPKIDFELAMAYRVLGDYDRVIDYLNTYIKARPYHALALYNLGFSYQRKKDLDSAAKYYRQTLTLKPMFGYIWQQLGQVYLEQGERYLAAEAFESALQYDPQDISASIGLRQTLKQQEIDTKRSRIIKMHFRRAQGYIEERQYDLATGEYSKVLKIEPNNSDALSNSAVVYIWKGMIRRAEVLLLRAIGVEPNNILAKENLNTILSRAGYKTHEVNLGIELLDIPILMYHKIGPELTTENWVQLSEFKKQMDILSKYGYTPVSLKSIYDYRLHKKSLPNKPVVITFDDGYESFYTKAYPVLKSHKFPSTVFLIPEQIGSKEQIYRAPLSEPFSDFMSETQIKRLAASGVVFGSHSLTHPTLTVMERGVWRKEIIDSKRDLESLGLDIDFFSYPYGKFTIDMVNAVKEAGYLGAVGAKGGLEELNFADLYALRRIFVKGGKDNPDSTFDFIRKLDPSFALPDIKIVSIEVLDAKTKILKKDFSSADDIIIRVRARNEGESTRVSCGLALEAKGRIVYPRNKVKGLDKHYLSDKEFEFEEELVFEYPVRLSKSVRSDEILADISFKDKYLLIEYFSKEDMPIFENEK